ncbi:MAG: gamma-glutamylcyclotransferase [Boseongicola sp.]|nr:MAG: gamma-glutamylcyclotransferase [Boseongicola sp.]
MTPYFFGYGSLVNRATHDYVQAHPARIAGWRRAWRHVEGRRVAFLTAVPDSESQIDGLLAEVPGGAWADLDAREHSYDRIGAPSVQHDLIGNPDIQIYHAPPERHVNASNHRPILLSYIDVVVQGYLREFGDQGVTNFFETTDGWDAPILNDRDDPIYPRHQILTRDETALSDHHMQKLGVQIVYGADAAFRA